MPERELLKRRFFWSTGYRSKTRRCIIGAVTKKNPSSFTILVVDDDPVMRSTIAYDLTRKGFQVLDAGSGQEALEVARNHPIALVLSDIRMPQGDGIELLKSLRLLNPSLPVVILMTGYADISTEDAIRGGALTVLQKPFRRDVLFKHISDILNVEL